jgi:hypothetical protein
VVAPQVEFLAELVLILPPQPLERLLRLFANRPGVRLAYHRGRQRADVGRATVPVPFF